MNRGILLDLLLFFVPFILYVSYLWLHETGRAARAAGHPTPWIRLFAAGLALALGGMVFVGLTDKHRDVSGLYDPDREVPTRKLPGENTP